MHHQISAPDHCGQRDQDLDRETGRFYPGHRQNSAHHSGGRRLLGFFVFLDVRKVTRVLQDVGNKLRERFAVDILAERSISDIAIHRTAAAGESTPVEEIVPKRVAYLIDQLKHPDEVALLRRVSGNLFFPVGVLTSEQQRRKNLIGEGLDQVASNVVMKRDRKDQFDHGQ